jgi:hypothetical protein
MESDQSHELAARARRRTSCAGMAVGFGDAGGRAAPITVVEN